MLLLLLPGVLSVLLLGAHFLRDGSTLLVLLLLALVPLLALRRRWVLRSLQAVLLLGAAEWLRTMIVLMQQRAALGEPYLRMMLILGGVALFSASAFLLLRSRRVLEHYGCSSPPQRHQ